MSSSTNTTEATTFVVGEDQVSIDPTEELQSPEVVAKALEATDPTSMLVAALRQMSAENRETTLEAIRELKRPSPEEQEKLDRERENLLLQSQRRVEAAKLQEAEIEARQANCSHQMPNGQTNFRGQVMSNGWAAVFCSHCWKTYTFEATDVEKAQSGLNVDKWGPSAHLIIQNRVKACAGRIPPSVPKVPAGATIIFG